ncbi:septation protein SepH [Nocardioides sambongensis]|uniref:septation protein SepH n=1 Tax=Nocardioides sambongensis TaxID=2589074 RepID=UPI001126C484|nr:septation protein SepH [Nocardioides sambongensis]
MAHLTLAGLSADGRRLLLVSEKGVEFTLDINPALRAALRGDTSRLGQLEIQMNSSLRPREIQIRIRAGESPEAVADAAGTTVQAIMPYVVPVVAERQHVAERAQRASLRRGPGESGPSGLRVLGETVAVHLRAVGADPTTVVWDAFRQETGRWMLTGDFTATPRSGTARFVFDPPGNYALADNDDARWLVGDLVESTETPRDDLQAARQRRLSAIPGDLPLGDDAIDLVTAPPTTPNAPAAAEPVPAEAPQQPEHEQPEQPAAEAPSEPGSEEPALDPTADEQRGRPRRPVQKKRGRASVPSWDEIMFGGGDQ